MEGPSLFLAAEQLSPLIGDKINSVEGNTKIGKERLENKKIIDIFSWGKHLVFQFDTFALRVHFMLFGSFEATILKKRVTGDYERKLRPSRLSLICKKGRVDMFSCSLQFIELSNAKQSYDFSTDIMSVEWDAEEAFRKIQYLSDKEIGDILLDQTIFSGVGNIIKNEALFLEKLSPERLIKTISPSELKKLIKRVQKYCVQFYEWRKDFVLRKHFQIYRKATCPLCKRSIVRKKTGSTQRWSYYCPHCQK